jgi:glutamate carboxypeptidase
MLDLLKRLVSVESGSRDKAAVDRMGAVYRELFEEMGFTTEAIAQPACGDHLIFRVEGEGKGKALVLAHIDTVWPVGTLESWPFTVTGNRVTGPGVGDMKGGIVQAIFAVRALRARDRPLPGRLTFFFTGDEELGSPTGRPHIERLGREHDAVLVVEPANAEGTIVSGRGGVAAFHLEVTGKSSHAAGGPASGASAIHALAHKIVEMEKLVDWDRQIMVNAGLIEGGSARQVLAERAAAWIDLRAPTKESTDELLRNVQAIVATEHVPRTAATLTGEWTRPPAPQTPGDRALVDRAAQHAAALGFTLKSRVSQGGSDGSFTSPLGVPTIDGLGPICGEPVSAREYIEADSLAERAALIALLLEDIALGDIPDTARQQSDE